MANSPVIQTALQYWAIKRETTPGTYAAASAVQDFLFVEQGSMEDVVEDVDDTSYTGTFAKTQGRYQGVQQAKVTLKGPVAQASFGHLMYAALGKLTESGAGDPYTHTAALRTAQGPSYSIAVYDATIANFRVVELARCQSLKLSYSNSKKFLAYEAVFVGKWADVSQVKVSANFDTSLHYLPWQGALTYGASNGKLVSLVWSVVNEVEAVPGSTGTQAINDVSQNVCDIDVEATFVPADATEYNLYRGNTQQSFAMAFTQGTHSLTLTTSKLAPGNGSKLILTGKHVTAMLKAKAVANTTDGGPGKIALLNAIATGVY